MPACVPAAAGSGPTTSRPPGGRRSPPGRTSDARVAPAPDQLAIKVALAATAPGVDVRGIIQAQRTEAEVRWLDHVEARLARAGTQAGLAGGLALAALLVWNNVASMQDPTWPVVVPWVPLVAMVVALPLLAAGATALFTPARPPLVRRVAE